ncbi:uncharacterized protein LOC118467977 [Anopheles albimanus]|uniref:uncharacterized protein LOC118467977 n=1 Tax=Anopheles albimanus TaxID=7167 RepID=UPI00163EE027|nr:uncharacterized protein LOC118467977 [Anopheles albimanus]
MCSSDLILLLGDFNQSAIDWLDDDPVCSSSSATAAAFFCDMVNYHGLHQRNTTRNALGRLLDLVLVGSDPSSSITVHAAPEPLTSEDPHHPALDIDLSLFGHQPVKKSTSACHTYNFDFRKVDFTRLSSLIQTIDWNNLLSSSDCNINVSLFTETIIRLFRQTVPLSRSKSGPPWSTALLRRLRRLRAKCLKLFNRQRSDANRLQFLFYSAQYKTLNKHLYASYIRRMQSNLVSNPRSFWGFVNSKRKSNRLPVSMHLGKNIFTTDFAKSEAFASLFFNNYDSSIVPNEHLYDALVSVPADFMDVPVPLVDESIIITAASKLKPSYTPGPDNIPSIVVKKCAPELAVPLKKIFLSSLTSGLSFSVEGIMDATYSQEG